MARDRVPDPLKKRCLERWTAGLKITEDAFKRGDFYKKALEKCDARMAAIIKWDERP